VSYSLRPTIVFTRVESPVMHAEQMAIRDAVRGSPAEKRPRVPGERASRRGYRARLFYERGTSREGLSPSRIDVVFDAGNRARCALPRFCVGRMKRVVYLIPDHKFGGAWAGMKQRYYGSYDLSL